MFSRLVQKGRKRVLTGIEAGIVLLTLLGSGAYGYRLHSTSSALQEAEAELVNSRNTISQALAQQSLGMRIQEFGAVEPPMEYCTYMSTFIRQSNELARKTGCTIRNINPKPAQPSVRDRDSGMKYQPVEIGLDISASYSQLDKFLDALSRMPKVAKIQNMSMLRQSPERTSQGMRLDIRLTIVLYLIESEKMS